MSGDHFRRHFALTARLVSQCRPRHHIADGKDVLHRGAALFIHLNQAAFVQLDLRVLEPQVVGVRFATDGHQHAAEALGDRVAIVLDIHIITSRSGFAHINNLGTGQDLFETLFAPFDDGLDQVLIGTGEEVGQKLYHGDS